MSVQYHFSFFLNEKINTPLSNRHLIKAEKKIQYLLVGNVVFATVGTQAFATGGFRVGLCPMSHSGKYIRRVSTSKQFPVERNGRWWVVSRKEVSFYELTEF